MGYHLNRLDEPIFKARPKPMQTKFGIHQRLECCDVGPTQTHAGCRWTLYDFLVHVDHVFLKDIYEINL